MAREPGADEAVVRSLPDPESVLSPGGHDVALGLAMAADAQKVARGELDGATFRARWNGAVQREFGRELPQPAPQERKGPRWGMVIDLQKCVGCDTCTVACKAENRTPPGVSYNVVLEYESGTFPNTGHVNLPRPCMQCDNAPCIWVCPVGATYKLENGIVAIDYERCIGCRYCIVACPYGARSFDFGEGYGEGQGDEMLGFNLVQAPEYGVPRGEREAGQSPVGNVRKCSFCLHRLERGEEPACVEACIADARYFGDLDDPDSLVARLASSPRAFRLREELGTEPRVYYLR